MKAISHLQTQLDHHAWCIEYKKGTGDYLELYMTAQLTPKHLEMHGCILSHVATDALMLQLTDVYHFM